MDSGNGYLACAPASDSVRPVIVLHRSLAGGEIPAAVPPPSGAAGWWHVSTCQRELWIGAGRAAATGWETYRGEGAYRFLLEVTTGLHSAIAGEANVAGQMKRAWRHFEATHGGNVTALAPWAAALFEDAGAVRRRHLHGIGGSSYGTLARMLVKPAKRERVLIVGTGDLSQSVLPAFKAFDMHVFDRRSEDPQSVAAHADIVLFCVPTKCESDAAWISALAARPHVRAVHFGLRRAWPGTWATVPHVKTLDDLFVLQQSQNVLRARKIAGARAACRELARRRWPPVGSVGALLATA